MDVQGELHRGTERALSLLVEKRQEAVFNDLLKFAADVTLVHPPIFLKPGEISKYDKVTDDEKIVQNLGARSLAALLEIQDGLHSRNSDSPEPNADDKQTEYSNPTKLITLPEQFSNTPNYRILENAERFGQALIDESFAILGDDADIWADKLRNASTPDEQLHVIGWLEHRISAISDRSRVRLSAEDERNHFYPPIRLSPKIIGSYPKPQLTPSCLSSSIIATSFFEKANMPVLHADVTGPGNDRSTFVLISALQSAATKEFLSDTPSEATDEQVDKILPILKSSDKWVRRNIAPHSAVYVQLKNGAWVQFDPYMSASIQLWGTENTHLESIFSKLNDWKGVVPNLEFSTSINPDRDMYSSSDENLGLSYVLSTFEYSNTERAELVSKIDNILKNIPTEASITYLYETCFKLLTNDRYLSKGNEDYAELTQKFIESAGENHKKDSYFDSRIARVFDAAIREFVRWDTSTEEFIKRCATENSYRARRANDFISLPSMMAVLNAKLSVQESSPSSHLSVDIGNPAMRIGLATLSDFAIYDDSPLPPQFWITHWPGMVSILENLEVEPTSDADRIFAYNNLLYQEAHPFTTSNNYDKINSFLSVHTKEKDDGYRQR